MPTENNAVARDERLVTLPMWIVEPVRVEVTKNRQRKKGNRLPPFSAPRQTAYCFYLTNLRHAKPVLMRSC